MKFFRGHVKTLAFAGLLSAGLTGGYAFAQSTNQVIYTPLGNELIQVYPPNTASVAYTSVSAIRDGRQYVYLVPVTAFTVSLTVDQSALSLNPAGTLAAGTVNFPATKVDGKIVTIFTTQTITSLTLATTNGAAITTPVTTLAANTPVGYVFSLASNAWRRIL